MKKLILLFALVTNLSFSQIQVSIFNASWNEANNVDWVSELKDVKTTSYVDISKNTELQKKYKKVVVTTIIIIKEYKEVARFQADLSFKMVATREEVQEEIDEQLMSDF